MRYHAWRNVDEASVVALKATGLTARQIGDTLGLTPTQVRGAVQRTNQRARQVERAPQSTGLLRAPAAMPS